MGIFSSTNNNNYFSSYIDIKAISTPSNPNSGIGRIFHRSSDNKLCFKLSNGTVVELGGGAGTVTSASNVGAGSGWFKQLNGSDLEFKSFVAGSNRISVTSNTNDLTINAVEANFTLSNIGGTLGNSKISDLAYSKLTGTPPKLDDLSTPDDNTDLDSTTLRHGLLPKLGGGTTNFLRADGTWSTPPGSGSSTGIGSNGGTASFDGDAAKTVFTIPHLLGDVPTGVSVEPSSTDAFGDFQVDKDATNITVTYASAPPSGTGNVVFEWMAVVGAVQNVHVAKGFASKSGDASTKIFTIAHGMASTPASAWVNPSSTDALGEFTTDIDSTNITITYTIAPPSGTNNLEYYWGALTPTGGIVGDGEANTMSNLGAGSQVFKQKNIFDFEIRSIIGGIGLDATQNANDITLDIDSTVVTLTGTQTLTNKTLTSPIISTISNTGTLTLPTATTTIVGRSTTDTLTNKTITAPIFDSYADLNRIAAPSDPGASVARIYHKQKDVDNDGIFAKYKVAGAITEVELGVADDVLSLTELSDVTITTPADEHVLIHNGTQWVNRAIVAGDLPATVALTNAANVFTAVQKINVDNGQQMTFYRPNNTAGFGVGFYYNLNNASSAEVTYGNDYVSVESNTAGSHRGDFNVQLAVAGSLGLRFRVFTSGDGGLIFGNNQRFLLSETGLTAQRTWTAPDSNGTFVGAATTQTLTNKTLTAPLQSSYEDFDRIAAPANPSSNQARLYNKQIDNNNDGLFTKVKRAGVFTEVPLYRQPVNPISSGRKWGSLVGTVVSPLNNLGLTVSAATGQASATAAILTSIGRYVPHVTNATTGSNAGGHSANLFQRAHNPYWSFRGRLGSATVSTFRTFFGLSSDAANSPSASDTYADSKSVAMFGHRTTDTNWQFIHNDGSATALYEDTGVAINTSLRTLEIFGDDTNTRFGWSIDGSTISWITTQVPASTTNLGIVHEVQTAENVAKSFDLIAMYIEFDSK